jgi:hypothetical protein
LSLVNTHDHDDEDEKSKQTLFGTHTSSEMFSKSTMSTSLSTSTHCISTSAARKSGASVNTFPSEIMKQKNGSFCLRKNSSGTTSLRSNHQLRKMSCAVIAKTPIPPLSLNPSEIARRESLAKRIRENDFQLQSEHNNGAVPDSAIVIEHEVSTMTSSTNQKRNSVDIHKDKMRRLSQVLQAQELPNFHKPIMQHALKCQSSDSSKCIFPTTETFLSKTEGGGGKRSSLILTSDTYEAIRRASIEHEKLILEPKAPKNSNEVDDIDNTNDEEDDFDSEISDTEVRLLFMKLM